MTKQKKQDSPAMQFVRLAWIAACGGIPHSWERFNQSVGDVCRLAAETFLWYEGDINSLCGITNHRYSILKCIGSGGLETMYASTVKYGNISFCTEYERYMGRQPIIADSVNNRQRDRIYIGSTFDWKGETVTVTSFGDDGKAIACSYKQVGESKSCTKCYLATSYPQHKLLHRYTISADDVKADRAERRRLGEPA